MDWTKIKTKHFLFTCMGDRELASLVKLLCLTAHLERIPKVDEIRRVCGAKTLEKLHKRFLSDGQSIDKVLAKVLQDVEKVTTKRTQGRVRQKTYRDRNASYNATDKIREDKIREDKSISNRGFKKPERQEVKKHFTEIFRMPWEADKFYDFYESKGWFVGKNKMKVWKSAASNWSKNAREKAQRDSQPKVVERPDRSRNNASSIAKSPNSAPPVQHCDPPPPEFRQMIDKLASEKGVS